MTARRRPGSTIVFVGPTLPAAEVAARLPDAEIAPPAAVGEVLARVVRRGAAPIARLAIIDGYFERMAAVWHKEVLVALEHGIAVYGAASMGALRAAELAPFGMVGVGAIYGAFVRGALAGTSITAAVTLRGPLLPALTCDDEVAVAHLPAEHGYRAVSDALVNLRDGLARAARAGAIRVATATALVELARARFYRERSWARLEADARDAGISARELTALTAWRIAARPDRKAADARQLLRRLAADAVDARAARTFRTPLAMPRTWAFRQLARLV